MAGAGGMQHDIKRWEDRPEVEEVGAVLKMTHR